MVSLSPFLIPALQLLQQQPQLKGKPVGVVPRDLPTNTSWFPPRGVSTGLGAVDCTSLAAELKGRIEQQTIGKEELKTMMAVLIGRRCRWGRVLTLTSSSRLPHGLQRVA